ncbi:MAG: CAP domain-containing protein [Defluviitaleaceae bacterium]|nr:CAP domain-containing protein [Defluviitaleaceae bacterium]
MKGIRKGIAWMLVAVFILGLAVPIGVSASVSGVFTATFTLGSQEVVVAGRTDMARYTLSHMPPAAHVEAGIFSITFRDFERLFRHDFTIPDNVAALGVTMDSFFCLERTMLGRSNMEVVRDGNTLRVTYNPPLPQHPVSIARVTLQTHITYIFQDQVTAGGQIWSWQEQIQHRWSNGYSILPSPPVVTVQEGVYVTRDTAVFALLTEKAQNNPARGSRLPNVNAFDVKAVSASLGGSSFAIDAQGTLWGWGANNTRQLGIGNNTVQRSPVLVMENIKAVSAGQDFTLALSNDGYVYSWGNDSFGSLGRGVRPNTAAGIQTFSDISVVMDNVIHIAAGVNHALAVRSDGSLWAWGNNRLGQLGDGTNTNRLHPFKIMDNVISAAAGENFSVALTADGHVWTWGDRRQLGDGSTVNRNRPAAVLNQATAIAAGRTGVLVLRNLCPWGTQVPLQGQIWGWGQSLHGRNTSQDRAIHVNMTRGRYSPLAPSQVVNPAHGQQPSYGFTQIDAGSTNAAALRNDGSMWIWVDVSSPGNSLGDGTAYYSHAHATPAMIIDKDVTAVSVGGGYTLAIRSNGDLWSWGINSSGQLGDGTLHRRYLADYFATTGTGITPGSEFSVANLRAQGHSPAQIQNIMERETFRLINVMRANYGIAPVEWNNALAAASRAHSVDRVNDPYTGVAIRRDMHLGTNGSTPGDRARLAGWSHGSVGENLAFNSTPLQSVEGWRSSTPHWVLVTSPNITHAGVGFANHELNHLVSRYVFTFKAASDRASLSAPTHTQQELRAIETRVRNQVNDALRAAGGRALPAATGQNQTLAEQSAQFGNAFHWEVTHDSNNRPFYHEFTIRTNVLNPNLSLTQDQLRQITHPWGTTAAATDFSTATHLAVGVSHESYEWDDQMTYRIVVFIVRR